MNRAVPIAVLAGLALSGCNLLDKPEAKPVAEAPQPVRVMTVAFAPQQTRHSYTGIVKPRVESDLGFRVTGKIVERLVDVGRRVKEGDVIARLDLRLRGPHHLPVADDLVPRRDSPQRHLVAHRHGFERGKRVAVHAERMPLGQHEPRHGDVIGFM